MLPDWLDSVDLTSAALVDIWARVCGMLAALLVMWAALAVAVRLMGLRTPRRGLAVCIIAAWAGLAGLAFPYFFTSMRAAGCRIDPTAMIFSPLLVFIAAGTRSLLGVPHSKHLAAWLGLAAIGGLVLGAVTLAAVTFLLDSTY
jgi:hypothetical protein